MNIVNYCGVPHGSLAGLCFIFMTWHRVLEKGATVATR